MGAQNFTFTFKFPLIFGFFLKENSPTQRE